MYLCKGREKSKKKVKRSKSLPARREGAYIRGFTYFSQAEQELLLFGERAVIVPAQMSINWANEGEAEGKKKEKKGLHHVDWKGGGR